MCKGEGADTAGWTLEDYANVWAECLELVADIPLIDQDKGHGHDVITKCLREKLCNAAVLL